MKNSPISPADAAQELLRRRSARKNLLQFTEYTTPNWRPSKIHQAICEQLERVRRKEIDRLLLLCPPQHGKSQIASRRFPAMCLGDNPTEDIIAVSATAELAEGFGRDVRNCISSGEYRNLFSDMVLAEDSQARGRWNTAKGGSYYATGVGGQLFGRGGNAIIDDPFASWADAQSETTRNHVWEWYQGTLYNRIRPESWIVVIQHRMHEDDLAGRLIAKQKSGGDRWEIVELPADVNDPPWPERYDRAALERIRANTDARQWSALYLQNPTPEEGTFFQRKWFKRYDRNQTILGHRYTTADYAVTDAEDGDPDYTEVGTHVYAPNGDLYLGHDSWSGRTTSDVWIDRTIDQFSRHKPLCFFGESGVIRRATEPFLRRRMAERRTFCRIEWITRTRDKPAMARSLQAMASMGKVWLPNDADGERMLSQLLAFPGSKRDDVVDMLGLMALAVDQAHPGVTPPVERKVVRDAYESEDEDEEDVA